MRTHKINYLNQKVYIGIDVHKKTYTFSAVCGGVVVKTATVPADPKNFTSGLKNWFSGGELITVYEAGFSGFGLHRILSEAGIKNIVINPASLEVAAKDKVKTDKRDSKKLAQQLSNGRLVGINIPSGKEEQARLITRTREQIVEDRTRVAARIKSRMHYFGLMDKDESRVVSEIFIEEIEEMNLAGELKVSFSLLFSHWRFLTQQLEEVKTEMLGQAFEDAENEAIYRSVPGIGIVGARVLSNELGDLGKRFRNQNALFQFVGLAPTEFSSGESVRKGSISRQGSSRVRKILVEASWRAISGDGALKEAFNRIARTRGSKRAIVAIARKLIGRIRACFVNQCEYATGIIK